MSKTSKTTLTVFEHQSLYLNDEIDDVIFDNGLLKAMQDFYGRDGVPYFSLLNKGVKFCEYVGVIQVGKITIEVLPKADHQDNKMEWRGALIDMLRSVGVFNIKAPTSTSLKVKPNSILDLYIELFLKEIEILLHLGLIKKYRKTDNNCTSLKGNLIFGKHIQKNLIHREYFFTRHTVYDVNHVLHQIIYKTLLLLFRINTNTSLQSRIGSLLLNFPEQSDIKVFESTFEKLPLNRKTAGYNNAIEIARLLLLNYHPNVSQGKHHVLALMFDMNMLWEKFVFVSLKQHLKKENNYRIISQMSKYFWQPEKGYTSSIIPDIVISYGSKHENCIVLDTKWKNLNGYNPSPDDLRQLYVYHEFYDAERVALIYPGTFKPKKGLYYTKHNVTGSKECSVMGIKVTTNISLWREEIGKNILSWAKNEV